MKYPIAIEWGNDKVATGIHIPDIPGAHTAGDTIEEAYQAAVEVADILLEDMAKQGVRPPKASSVDDLKKNPEFDGMGWGFIDIDVTPYMGKTEQVSVTLPASLIADIDDYVSLHGVKSRSAFLADAALKMLQP